MRNVTLKGFLKKSPLKQELPQIVSDSSRRGLVSQQKPIEIISEKKKTDLSAHAKGFGGKTKIFDTTKRNVSRVIQANPIATLLAGRKTKS